MNRRDLLKAGVTVASSGFVTRTLAAAQCDCARAAGPSSGTGTLSIVFHGLAVLDFAPQGKAVDVRWLTFKRESLCDVPVHLPKLCLLGATTCKGMGDRKIFPVAGLRITPVVDGERSLDAESYDLETKEMVEYPRTPDDWESFKWVPKLPHSVDAQKLEEQTLASIFLQTGRLRPTSPFFRDAHTQLWTLTKPSVVKKKKGSLTGLPQQALTDKIRYTVPFSGASVKLRFTPVLEPPTTDGARPYGFELEFTEPDGNVELLLDSDAPKPGERLTTQAVLNYCAYYQVAQSPQGRAIEFDERTLPYKNGRFPVAHDYFTAVRTRFPDIRLLEGFQIAHGMSPLDAGHTIDETARGGEVEPPKSGHDETKKAAKGGKEKPPSSNDGLGSLGKESPDPYCGSMRLVRP